MDWSYSNFQVVYIHEEKVTRNFSAKPTLELLFAKNARANSSKNASSLAHRASNNKNELVAHPTAAMVTLSLSQYNNQPTILRH
jgi:hypothetical protein